MPACTRCRSELSYAGRPCPVCISSALFVVRDSRAVLSSGAARAATSRMPRFALPPALRGKKIRVPRSQRVVSALAMAGRWTWNSLAIAALIHAIAFAAAFYFKADLERLTQHIQRVSIDPVAIAPMVAPVEPEIHLPEIRTPDDELQLPPTVDEPIDAGDPEFEPPPDITPFAPLPEQGPPQPGLNLPLPQRAPQAHEGLAGGQPAPSKGDPPGGSGLLSNRKGESRAAAVKRFGGGEDTEGAVNLGLEYLARNQEPNGSWDPNHGFERPPRWAEDGNAYRGAVTALCVLPFLAAGNSPEEGKYARNVQRAITWLMNSQTSDGCVTFRNAQQMYTHTVATLALCEAYGMTRDARIRISAERAVRFLERTQHTAGGWDYNTSPNTSSNRAAQRNDLSITGWGVLALKSAQAVGLKISPATLKGLADLYHRYSLDTGETYYADRAHGSLSPTRRGIGMVGVGLTARVILDPDRFLARNNAAEKLLLEGKPDYKRMFDPSHGPNNPNFNTFYGWYYGTLGMFLKNEGRGAAWETWNTALKESLLPNQVKEGKRRGSWPADDTWIGPLMGDFYSTACAVLCLEVYYRYNPLHKPESEIRRDAGSVLRPAGGEARRERETSENLAEIGGEVLDMDRPAERSRYLRLLSREKGMVAVSTLIDYLADESATVRTTALHELGRLKAADSVERVIGMLSRGENRDIRVTICDTLGRIGNKSAAQPLIRLLGDEEESVSGAARSALVRLADGRDLGVNRHAWANHFGVSP